MAHSPRSGLVITDEFDAALQHLATGGHLFLTGKAGTGKSTLIRHFMETTDRAVTVVAPTGIAALNVNGYTIHRLFSLVPHTTIEDVWSPGSDYYPARFASVLKGLQTLIIDEASMVRADLLDKVAAALERFGPRPGELFGGVQIVLVGDLYQLPPVVKNDIDDTHRLAPYATPYFFSSEAFRRAEMPVVELTRVFRQQGDAALVDILNKVREGVPTPGDLATLNARTNLEFVPPPSEFWLTLTTTNKMATARNRRALDQLPPPDRVSSARVWGVLDGFEKPTDDELRLRLGAQVMMLTNDPLDRWVNGSLGRVVAIGEDDDGGLSIEVELRRGRRVAVRPHTWPVTRPRVEGRRVVHDEVGGFTQLPFRLAWAITIHKSQGQTVDRLVVDLSGGTFADGQLYVALSRVTAMDGLVLTRSVLSKDLRVDTRVRRFLSSQPSLFTQAAGTTTAAKGLACFGVCFVGDEGARWKPRPAELAVVTDDGREFQTLVNPTRDLGDARSSYGVTAEDVQLAPQLADAWAALAPHLYGLVPVANGVDVLLGYLDFELKRGGTVFPMPIGLDVVSTASTVATTGRTALERARAVRDAARNLGWRGLTGFGDAPAGLGYFMPRTENDTVTIHTDASPAVLADRLREAAEMVPLTPRNQRLLTAFEHVLGVDDQPAEAGSADARPTIDDILTPGTRICFTGEPHHDGRAWGRTEMEALADERGLIPVDNVTKTRCDVLVCAEAGTLSGKAKKSATWGKPVVTSDEFFGWLERRATDIIPVCAHAVSAETVCILPLTGAGQ